MLNNSRRNEGTYQNTLIIFVQIVCLKYDFLKYRLKVSMMESLFACNIFYQNNFNDGYLDLQVRFELVS